MLIPLGDFELHRVIADSQRQVYEGVEYLPDLLNLMLQNDDIFHDDRLPVKEDYSAWLDHQLAYMNDCYPWFFVVVKDGVFRSAIWAHSWTMFGERYHSVEIGAVSKRKISMSENSQTLRLFSDFLFTESKVSLLRAYCDKDNRAARLALLRGGFSHPQALRAHKMKDGNYIDAIGFSLTREENEVLNDSRN